MIPQASLSAALLGNLALCLAVVAGSGCGGKAPRDGVAARAPSEGPSPSTKEYPLAGVVRQVEVKSGLVTIRHREIPGFMDAMTMPFDVKDREVLDDLRPGDEVEGTLRVLSERGVVKDYELVDLQVTRPAPAPKMTLNLSGGAARLGPAPRLLKVGETVPDFAMTTQEGEPLKLSDLRGKVVALTFIYTRCPLPDFCPLMDRKFAELADRIGAVAGRAEHVRLLSVSFDPEHDTPEVLRKHAEGLGARPPLWRFAVASHEELGKVAAPLGLTYGPAAGEIIHNLSTAVIDPQGKLVRLDVGASSRGWKSADLLKVIYSRIPKSGR
jgi:protein SCO1